MAQSPYKVGGRRRQTCHRDTGKETAFWLKWVLRPTGAHRREELLSARARTNSGMRWLFRGSLSEDRDVQAKARGEEHGDGWSRPRSSACLEDKTGERSLGGGGSTQTGRLRGDVRRCAHVWQACQDGLLERLTCKGRVGSAGDRALQLGLIWSEPSLRRCIWRERQLRETRGWSPRGLGGEQKGPEWG